jgi:hypothetical protein
MDVAEALGVDWGERRDGLPLLSASNNRICHPA